jgi:hypothetical protein
VMAMGGFSGGDRAMTQDRLADLVADGSLRFISVQGGFGGAFPGGGFPGGTLPGGDPTAEPAGDGGGTTGVPGGGPRSASVVMDVVRSVCTEVPATNWGDSSTTSTGLYDCQGQSAALRDAEPNAEPSAQEPAPSESPGTVPADQPPPGADMDALVGCLAESGVELPDPAAGQPDAETMAALQACSAELGLPAPPGG